MGWKKTPGVAQYKGADWDNFVSKQSGFTPEQAMRYALRDPEITFFFICRENLVLEGPVFDAYGAFVPGDAVFFKGEPWFGDAPQADSYERTGLSVAYISPKDTAQFSAIADYTLADGAPAIDVVCLFAASYAADTRPYLRANNNQPVTQKPLNDNLQDVVDSGAVATLQAKGITVLLSVLNGWAKVGWSEFTSQAAAKDFADYLKTEMVEKYGLDGIDIDDEYSAGTANDTSLIMVTNEMKAAMPDKLITKALFSDSGPFQASLNGVTLADNLHYGWEMSYWSDSIAGRLGPYVNWGMDKGQLVLGFSADPQFASQWPEVGTVTGNVMRDGYGGGMVYEFENQPDALGVAKSIVNAINGPGNWNKS